MDFEKVFNSVYGDGLWGILRQYVVFDKLIRMITVLYDGFKCSVLHEGKFSSFLDIESGVKRGCLLSSCFSSSSSIGC